MPNKGYGELSNHGVDVSQIAALPMAARLTGTRADEVIE